MVVCVSCKPGTDNGTIENIRQLGIFQLKSCSIKRIVTIFYGFAVVKINVQLIVGTVPFQCTVIIRPFAVFFENERLGKIAVIARSIFPLTLQLPVVAFGSIFYFLSAGSVGGSFTVVAAWQAEQAET